MNSKNLKKKKQGSQGILGEPHIFLLVFQLFIFVQTWYVYDQGCQLYFDQLLKKFYVTSGYHQAQIRYFTKYIENKVLAFLESICS